MKKPKRALPLGSTLRSKPYLLAHEVGQFLGVTRNEIAQLEAHGELEAHHGPADLMGRRERRFHTRDVVAVRLRRDGYTAQTAAHFETQILDRIDAGEGDTTIVRALVVPLEVVQRLRVAHEGGSAPGASSDDQKRAKLRDAVAQLEAKRKARASDGRRRAS